MKSVDHSPRSAPAVAMLVLTMLVSVLTLSACDLAKKDKINSQTAAKVNKEELTIHQVNYVLQQQRGLKPEQMESASRQVLDRLIDQELALQKAEELKLDRDPKVVQQLQASRREIIARAFAEKTGDAAAKPTAEEVKKYFDENPALFKERRIYSIQELLIEAKPEQIDTLKDALRQTKNTADFIEYLKAKNYKFSGSQAVRPAEQIPMTMLPSFAKLRDGQAMLTPSVNGAQVIVLAGSRSEPIDDARAKPVIEVFLTNEARRRLLEGEIKNLRGAAKIEYVGKFADMAASAASVASGSTTGSSVAKDSAAINSGLSGLK